MEKKELTIDYRFYENSQPEEYLSLCRRALEAAGNAYSVYSGFSVGAAVLLENGEIFTGNNQENISYPEGLCAERVVLNYIHANFPDCKVRALAIAATVDSTQTDHFISPCGGCRQVMAETVKRFGDFDVILSGQLQTVVVKASDLLPWGFGRDYEL